MADTQPVWFITGCSSGFGRAYAEAVIAHGDRLVATARNVETLQDLVTQAPDRVLAAAMDVTNASAIASAVAQALATFGRIDVLVNNAGFGLTGAIEEVSDDDRNYYSKEEAVEPTPGKAFYQRQIAALEAHDKEIPHVHIGNSSARRNHSRANTGGTTRGDATSASSVARSGNGRHWNLHGDPRCLHRECRHSFDQ